MLKQALHRPGAVPILQGMRAAQRESTMMDQRIQRRLRGPLETLKTVTLLAALAAVAALTGYAIVGPAGLIIGLLVVAFLTAVGMRAPADLVMRLSGARPVSYWSAPELFDMVARLARRANIPAPRLYLLPSAHANAMAAGSGDQAGALAVTAGALRLLRRDELEGVLAHEIAHLHHGDTSTMQLANTIAQSIGSLLRVATWLAFFTLLLTGAGLERLLLLMALGLFVPVVVGMLRASLSRTRELAADATAAELTGKPWALASALAKLEQQQRSWLERLFGARPELPAWMRSHPSTAERVRRLLQLAGLPA